MAARTVTGWMQVNVGDFPVSKRPQDSAIRQVAVERTMESNQQDEPRWLDADVSGGSALTEDTNNGDAVSMYGYQFNGKATFDHAMSEDTKADEFEAWAGAWLSRMNVRYDNACIGVSGVRSATVGDFRPYTSIYKAVRTNDTGAGYTADANYAATGTGGLTYANLNAAKGRVEDTEFWQDGQGVILFHPTLMENIRGIMDNTGRPIFMESTSGDSAGAAKISYSIFGCQAFPTFGARVSPSFQMAVLGNPLVVFASTAYLRYGKRIEPEVRLIPYTINTLALEDVGQARARRGFVATIPQANSVLEVG